MPSNRKLYQKKTEGKENFTLLKFFFCPLCAISLFISRLKTFIRLSAKVVLRHGCPDFKVGVLYIARPLFSFETLRRIGQRRGANRAA